MNKLISCSLSCLRTSRAAFVSFKNINTLTPLTSAFNNPSKAVSPRSCGVDSVGLFGIPELKTGQGFHCLKENVLKTADSLVDQAIAVSPSSEVVSVFDTLSDELCKVADLAEFVRLAHPEVSYVNAAESTSFEIGGFVEKLNTNYDLYKALQNTLLHDNQNIDHVTKTVANLFLFDFEQSGIHLDGQKRKLAVELHETALVLGARFAEGTSFPRNYPVSKWPRELKIPYALDKTFVIVDSPYNDSNDYKLRQVCYEAFMSPCDNQQYLLENLLCCRHQLASILGFDSFSHRTLNGTMAQTPEKVLTFLHDTLSMLEKHLDEEMNLITDYKKQHHLIHDGAVTPVDLKYYTGLITSQMYNLNSQHIREYFSVGACMEGLNIIFTSLYGVSLNVIEANPGEVWEPGVQKVEVRHETEGILGHIYCDLYQRPGKLPQDCHFTIRGIYVTVSSILFILCLLIKIILWKEKKNPLRQGACILYTDSIFQAVPLYFHGGKGF